LRTAGLFVIPEELHPPPEIRAAVMSAGRLAPTPGFADAVVDPVLNALICATSTPRTRPSETSRRERSQVVRAALVGGPDALAEPQKMRIIGDPDALSELHAAVWTSDDAHPCWSGAIGRSHPAARDSRAEMQVALGAA
jgi:membrane glycosyltransferase